MDVSILFKIAAIGVIITVICQILKKSDRDDIATLVSIVGLIIVLGIVVSMVGDLFSDIQRIFNLYAPNISTKNASNETIAQRFISLPIKEGVWKS